MSNPLTVDPPITADFLTVNEAAAFARVHAHLIWDLLKAGTLTRHRRARDKRTYIKTAELEAVMRPKPVEKKATPFSQRRRTHKRSEEF